MTERTVKEFAAIERVTERTVRLWLSKGAVDYRRTPGGGIRIIDQRAGVVFVGMKTPETSGNLSK